MTNRDIKKYMDERAVILKELCYERGTELKQYMLKLVDGIKKLQRLSEIVDARKYMGFGLSDMESMVRVAQSEQLNGGSHAYKKKCDTYENICKEMSDNILYKLQTEMMFNACVSANRSCLFAAVAAIAACISAIFAMVTVLGD